MRNQSLLPLKSMSTTKPVSKVLVHQKSKMILADVDRLKKLLGEHSYEDLVSDDITSTLAERWLERMVNRAVDINFHLIRSTGSPPPDDYTASFLELGKLKILPSKLAHRIAPAAGARNILVHEYDNLDTRKFYSSLKDSVRLFPQYITAIERWMER